VTKVHDTDPRTGTGHNRAARRPAPVSRPGPARRRTAVGSLRRALTGGATLLWAAIVVVPVYWLVVTSLRSRTDFTADSPPALPGHPTLDNYRAVLDGDFTTYLLNSVVVTAGTVVLTVAVALMAAFAIVRGAGSRLSRVSFRLYLLGLAIPLQAVIIPVYLLIIRMRLYDSLLAIVLELAPGERATVRFHVHTDRLAFTGLAGRRIVEPGEIELHAGSSSLDTPVRDAVRLVGEERDATVLRHHGVPVTVERE